MHGKQARGRQYRRGPYRPLASNHKRPRITSEKIGTYRGRCDTSDQVSRRLDTFDDHDFERGYTAALSNPTELTAIKLASASEFGCAVSAEAVVLAKAALSYTNIAINLLAEIARLVSDNHGNRYLARIAKLQLPKRGESIQDFFMSIEDDRKSLKQLQMPEMIFFRAWLQRQSKKWGADDAGLVQTRDPDGRGSRLR